MQKALLSLLLLVFITIASCNQDHINPATIVEETMMAHGTDVMDNATVDFNFRGIDYSVSRSNGYFEYSRSFNQAGNKVVDRLTNDGFTRSINDSIVQLPDSLSSRYRSSLNSVVYFAQLPYGLDNPAVNLEYLGTDSIKQNKYHEIKVTFDETGGGEDHEDEFLYWINVQDSLIDYLAYSYCEEDCGLRFRESINRKNIKGIVIQDYNNYNPEQEAAELEDLDRLFEKDQLNLLSTIRTEFPEVSLNDEVADL
ncbi:DUF6503 family protein [Nonlabens ponticola]|uniref:Deoxyribose-phosphate aldolase n=1 Tax=Nonlabens ponticola TaxID=2496866 RepID=A0A3S9MY72_9FLAO|nr:DUF6503 family protein [Nonlabens ponticola]AZQ44140.1 hypothetical protein EJ995_07805 [Nonlabens ponticola]